MSMTNKDDWKIIMHNRKNINKKDRVWEYPEEEQTEDLSDIELNFDREGDS